MNNKSKIKINTNRQLHSFDVEVYIHRFKNNGRDLEVLNFEDGEEVWNSYEQSEGQKVDVEPTLTVKEPLLDEIVEAFLTYADDSGIDKPSESHIKGKLEAKDDHLQDLRKIVFNTNNTKED